MVVWLVKLRLLALYGLWNPDRGLSGVQGA